ncbi:hypothetical protein BDV3_000150 [Batrachochytrium dendrobatidis]|uniref:GPI transamidase component PIG-S n=1 Tax=Batrachochytrium dendrobatidis (strain JEL423) TaxID=403673 RepID=A0A177WBI8_BATDL|nr:hypothetical protein BDEG_21170 [Batrachochytrium dendrobatidis JEL423]
MKVELEQITTHVFLTRRTHIVFSIWVVIILALPIWWRTTEVYRAPLPFEAIRSWETTQALSLNMNMGIQLCFSPKATEQVALQIPAIVASTQMELESIFSATVPDHSDTRHISLTFSVDAKECLHTWDAQSVSAKDFDDGLGVTYNDNGVYSVYMDCAVEDDTDQESVFVGKNRALLLNMHKKCTKELAVSRIVSTLTGIFSSEQLGLIKLYKEKVSQDADRKSMRVVKYAPAYQVVLSLLVGDPESVMVSWDAQAAASAYIQPFLFELNAISEFTISSQILNYASLPIQPEKGQDGNGNTAYYMNVKALSNFLNSAEWNLASVVSSASPINLILYIPPMEQTPLHVLHYNGTVLDSNSFLIPQWGGVVIRNVPNEFRQIHYNLEKLHPIMEIFVEQLRGLLGIDSVCIVNEKMLLPNVRVEYGDASEIGMTRWELDRLIRSRTVQNMANAAQTLISLANLLERLSGMVVLDLIKYYVTDSLNYLNMTKHELSTCQFTNAAQYARRAVTSAEAAFFDPTMVPLLYFPDEHKFAIYMPYFVPVTVPLILALFREVRLWISKKREAKLKSKTE